MIPSKIATDVPRRVEKVRDGMYVARNSYSGRYVFFERGDQKNAAWARLEKARPQSARAD